MASDAAAADAAPAAAAPPPAPSTEAATTAEAAVLTVTVSDPVKLGEGMHAYISYKINTKTDDPAFDYNSPSTEMPRKCTISKSTLMML